MSITNTFHVTPTPSINPSGPMQVLFKGATIPFNDMPPTILRFEDCSGPLEIDIVALGGGGSTAEGDDRHTGAASRCPASG